MVDQLSYQLQWETSSDIQMGPDNRVRRIPQGLGSVISGEIHRRTLDSGEMQATHQLPGAVGCISGSKSVCREQGKIVDPPSTGQHHGNCLHQQDGWHPLRPPIRSCGGDLELVHLQEHNDPCGTSPRTGECEGRLGVTSPSRLKRLDAASGCLPTVGIQGRSFLHPLVCIENQHPASPLLQLEGGPRRTSSGCLLNHLEGPQSIPVPSLCTDTQVPEQAEGGEGDSLANCTSLAKSDLVPSTSGLPGGLSHPPSPNPTLCPARTGPLAEKGHLPLAGWCVSRDPALRRVYQTESLRSSGSPGGPRLSQHTTMPGDSGLVGALKGKQIHFQLL